MTKPVVVIDPGFRSMAEIFDPATLDRLNRMVEVVQGPDEVMDGARLLAEADRAVAVVFGQWRDDWPAIDRFGPQLRALLEVAGGHEHRALDYQAALDRGLRLGSCAPAFGPEVAEHGLALALACLRGVTVADRHMRLGTERWLHAGNAGNNTLLGATVGFVGCGTISRHLQQLLDPFQVDILGFDPPMPTPLMIERGITPTPLDVILQQASVVFVLAAPTPTAEHLIDRSMLELLGPGQALIILSRGSLVDFDAMEALASKRGFRVGVDVYPSEPLEAGSQIRRLEQATLTPHLAGALPSALNRIGRMVVDDLEAIIGGKAPDSMSYLRPENQHRYLQIPGSGSSSET